MGEKWQRKRWTPIKECQGPWLIRSHYHNAWHCKSSVGGACGYTDDITEAGVFDFAKAREYHDAPPNRRDEAVPASRVVNEMERLLANRAADLGRVAVNIQAIRRAMKAES